MTSCKSLTTLSHNVSSTPRHDRDSNSHVMHILIIVWRSWYDGINNNEINFIILYFLHIINFKVKQLTCLTYDLQWIAKKIKISWGWFYVSTTGTQVQDSPPPHPPLSFKYKTKLLHTSACGSILATVGMIVSASTHWISPALIWSGISCKKWCITVGVVSHFSSSHYLKRSN